MKKKSSLIFIFILMFTASLYAKTVNVTDYGAIPDDGQCDTEAIRGAVNDVKVNHGGTIIFPAGVTKLCGQVDLVDFGNYVSYKFVGDQGAEISVELGPYGTGLVVGNVNQFTIENLIFTGANVPSNDPKFIDCKTLIHFNTINLVTVKDSQFIGLWCYDSVIYSGNVDLNIDTVEFGGSMGKNAAVYAENFRGLTVRNTIFVDYANYKSQYWSKSASGSFSWITATNAVMPDINAMSSKLVRIQGARFDEGAHTAIILRNLPFALISGINVNVSSMSDGRAVYADNVEKIDVEFSQFGFTTAERNAVRAVNDTFVFVKRVKFGGGVTLGTADSTSTIYNEDDEIRNKSVVKTPTTGKRK